MVADHWFMQVVKVLEAMEIASNTTRIKLAAFPLEGEAQVWWNWAKTSRDLEAMTWAEFHDLFMGKYFSNTAHHAKAQEFLELKQGTTIVLEYVARFTELAHFADDYVATDMAKVRRFENGLKLSIRGRIVRLRLQDIVTPPIPVRPDWRIRTGFGVRNHILRLHIFFFFFFFFRA